MKHKILLFSLVLLYANTVSALVTPTPKVGQDTMTQQDQPAAMPRLQKTGGCRAWVYTKTTARPLKGILYQTTDSSVTMFVHKRLIF